MSDGRDRDLSRHRLSTRLVHGEPILYQAVHSRPPLPSLSVQTVPRDARLHTNHRVQNKKFENCHFGQNIQLIIIKLWNSVQKRYIAITIFKKKSYSIKKVDFGGSKVVSFRRDRGSRKFAKISIFFQMKPNFWGKTWFLKLKWRGIMGAKYSGNNFKKQRRV